MNSINASLPSLTFARPQMLASNPARSDAKDDSRDNAVTTTKSVSLDVKQQAAARAAESTRGPSCSRRQGVTDVSYPGRRHRQDPANQSHRQSSRERRRRLQLDQ